jgi:ankyrin repeat protein
MPKIIIFKSLIDVINEKDNKFTEPYRISVINNLLSKGIDVNLERDKFGYTPLMCAVKKGYTDIVKFLVEKGAQINLAGVNGLTSLHCAAQQGELELVKFLMEKGANVNQLDEFGGTPLHLTLNGHPVKDNHMKVADYLIKNNADLNIQMNKDSWYSLKGKLPFPNIPEELMKIALETNDVTSNNFTKELYELNAECESHNKMMAGKIDNELIGKNEDPFDSYFN